MLILGRRTFESRFFTKKIQAQKIDIKFLILGEKTLKKCYFWIDFFQILPYKYYFERFLIIVQWLSRFLSTSKSIVAIFALGNALFTIAGSSVTKSRKRLLIILNEKYALF